MDCGLDSELDGQDWGTVDRVGPVGAVGTRQKCVCNHQACQVRDDGGLK